MIVIDTSAVMAIALGEPTAADCSKAIENADRFFDVSRDQN